MYMQANELLKVLLSYNILVEKFLILGLTPERFTKRISKPEICMDMISVLDLQKSHELNPGCRPVGSTHEAKLEL